MKDGKHVFVLVVILNFIEDVLCEDQSFTGLVAASTIAGVLLVLVILVAVIFALWRDAYKRAQLKQGRIKVPRSWLDHERIAKRERKQRIKQHIKEQKARQKNSTKAIQNNAVDMEMQYMHRSRPQIPGSWRREIRHPNGYIVQEVPTLQRTLLVEGNKGQPVIISDDSAIWQPSHAPTKITYSQLTNPSSTVVPLSSRSDGDNSSVSSDSMMKGGLKNKYNREDEVLEATIDFTQDGAIGDDQELQERATAF